MNVFELHGPMFLFVYVVLFVVSIYGAFATYDYCLKVNHSKVVPNLDPYEIAYLSGGSARCFLAAVATLMERKLLEVDVTKKSITPTAEASEGLNPFEHTLLDICEREHTTDGAYKQVQAALRQTRDNLQALKLLATDDTVGVGVGMAFLELVSLPAITGLIQLFTGLASHRPVGFLIALLFISSITAVLLPAWLTKNRLTDFGREVLDKLQEQNSALQWNCKTNPGSLTATELAVAFGLFGAGAAAAGSTFLLARKALTPSTSSGCGGGACGGGGCGGGGCHGGGGCGGGSCGGGCGGGGCGGCGG